MNKKGFTLIELLIVVVIIGILAAIAIPRFGETRERAYISAMQSDINQVRTAQEMYYQDNNFNYAAAIGDLDATLSAGVTVAAGPTPAGNNWSIELQHEATDVTCTYDTDPASANPGVIVCDEPAAP